MAKAKLTTASYLVLGLVEARGPSTPYELKGLATVSVSNFWALPHTQIYAQCERLAELGLLAERREEKGRRRREFTITDAGRSELEAWRDTPTGESTEYRDLGMLKLFFGADPQTLAAERLEIHERQLKRYEALANDFGGGMTDGMKLALEAGIGQEREFVRFWRKVASSNLRAR